MLPRWGWMLLQGVVEVWCSISCGWICHGADQGGAAQSWRAGQPCISLNVDDGDCSVVHVLFCGCMKGTPRAIIYGVFVAHVGRYRNMEEMHTWVPRPTESVSHAMMELQPRVDTRHLDTCNVFGANPAGVWLEC